jgi:hypothetical protein
MSYITAGPSMSDCIIRVEKLENGYEVEICDPKIMAENEKPKSSWQDPWKGYAFTTSQEAVAFISEHMDSLKSPPDADKEYGDAFKQAANEDN